MLFSGALILFTVYVGICTLLFLFQRSLLFPRGSDIWRDPSAMDWRFDDLWLEHAMGRSHAWYIYADDPEGTIIFSHGNAGTIADRLESVEDFIGLGYDVLIYDYGGYGNSDGKPTEDRCYADIQAAWDYVLTKGAKPSNIVLFGRSLGAGPTTWLATHATPGAVILESALTSVPDMAQEAFPFLPARWLVRDRFDNLSRIGQINCPVLVIHSREDEIIPFQNGERLFAAAKNPKQFVEIQGGHNDGWYLSRQTYRAALATFIASAADTQNGSKVILN